MGQATAPARAAEHRGNDAGYARWRPNGGRLKLAAAVAAAAIAGLVVLPAVAPSSARSAAPQPRLALEDGSAAPAFYQRLLARAKTPTPKEDIVLALRGCPGAESRSCVPWGQARIHLAPGQENARYFYHELGHIFDRGMAQQVREEFLQIRGDDRPWLTDRNSPLEQFAEAYSLCAINGEEPLHGGIVGYGYEPSVRHHRRICRLIGQAEPR